MYYLIRIIFIILLTIIAFIFIRKNKTFFYRKRNIMFYLISILSLIIILQVSFYPFEGYFLTFNTIEESLSYKCINTENICIYEYDNCAFVVDNDHTIYSLTKINQQYKLVDFHSENIEYTQSSKTGSRHATEPMSAKFNKDANKVFYYIGLMTDKKPEQEVTLDGEIMTYCTSSTTEHLIKSQQREYWIYSYVDNSLPKPKLVVKADYLTAELYKTPYIRGITDK